MNDRKFNDKIFFMLCFFLLIPKIIYSIYTFFNNENKTILTIVNFLLVISVVTVLTFYILNLIISKYRKKIYYSTYTYPIKKNKIQKLLKFPQLKINWLYTYLYLSYANMNEFNFEESINLFTFLKKHTEKEMISFDLNYLPSFYLILIYFYLDSDELEREIDYFKKIKIRWNNDNYKYINSIITDIENKHLSNLLKKLELMNTGSSFMEQFIKKITL